MEGEKESIDRRSFMRRTAGLAVGVMGVGALPAQSGRQPLPIELYSPLVFDDLYFTDEYYEILAAEARGSQGGES